MARNWTPRPTPQPTSITEICRRYYACALALSKVMGVPLTETFMQEHHSAISSTFIETSRCELRLPASVTLPPLAPPNGQGARQPEASNRAMAEAVGVSHVTVANDMSSGKNLPAETAIPPENADGPGNNLPPEPEEGGEPAVPTSIPADGDLPCAGQEIAALKPAALAMLLAKTATLAHRDGACWAPLLHALTREREARLARGRRPVAAVPPPNGGRPQA
jgi:hypothetical protein